MPKTTCTGSNKQGKPCDCPSFIPRRSKPNKCTICCHRRSVHETAPDASSDDSDAATEGGGSYVKRILTAIKSTSVLENAKKETAQGFRPVPISAPLNPPVPTTKGKGKARQASDSNAPATSVKFGRIVFFPCGENNIEAFKGPTISTPALQHWVTAGLVVEAADTAITFPLDWGTKQFNGFLRAHFPVLFAHFDSTVPGFKAIPNEPDNVGIKQIKYSLPYILLRKERMKYPIIDEAHPTAEMYNDNIAGGKARGAGFRTRTLFFVTREPIPDVLLREWFPKRSKIPAIPRLDAPTLLTPSPSPPSSPLAGKNQGRSITPSISVSSDSSDDSGPDMGASNDPAVTDDEDTETDTDNPLDVTQPPTKRRRDTDNPLDVTQPPIKRRRCVSPRSQGCSTPEFVEGSSRNHAHEVEHLTHQLQQSASFEDRNSYWYPGDRADIWEF